MSGPLVTHVHLSRTDAASWKAAVKAVAGNVCPANAGDLDKKAGRLKEQNQTHLKEAGAYGSPELNTPADADHRAFSRLRSDVEIFVVIKDLCAPSEAKVEPAPAKEEPKPTPLPEQKPEPAPEPKPEPKPELKPEANKAKKPAVKKQERQREPEKAEERKVL